MEFKLILNVHTENGVVHSVGLEKEKKEQIKEPQSRTESVTSTASDRNFRLIRWSKVAKKSPILSKFNPNQKILLGYYSIDGNLIVQPARIHSAGARIDGCTWLFQHEDFDDVTDEENIELTAEVVQTSLFEESLLLLRREKPKDICRRYGLNPSGGVWDMGILWEAHAELSEEELKSFLKEMTTASEKNWVEYYRSIVRQGGHQPRI